MKILSGSIAVVLIAFALLVSSNEDYQEEGRQVNNYCQMTEAGLWGKYDDSIKCEDK